MGAPHRELFVYYRVRAGAEARAASLVSNFQADLMARVPGLRARLLQKDEFASANPTWMETYAVDERAGSSDSGNELGISLALQAAIEAAASALADCVEGSRHVEAFNVGG